MKKTLSINVTDEVDDRAEERASSPYVRKMHEQIQRARDGSFTHNESSTPLLPPTAPQPRSAASSPNAFRHGDATVRPPPKLNVDIKRCFADYGDEAMPPSEGNAVDLAFPDISVDVWHLADDGDDDEYIVQPTARGSDSLTPPTRARVAKPPEQLLGLTPFLDKNRSGATSPACSMQAEFLSLTQCADKSHSGANSPCRGVSPHWEKSTTTVGGGGFGLSTSAMGMSFQEKHPLAAGVVGCSDAGTSSVQHSVFDESLYPQVSPALNSQQKGENTDTERKVMCAPPTQTLSTDGVPRRRIVCDGAFVPPPSPGENFQLE